jgi:class 3 adenylate cyclase
VERPETNYVEVGGGQVGFQVIGDGPVDLVALYGLGAHIDLFWDEEFAAHIHRQLASFSRLILFDRRGTGASDPVYGASMPTWEEWADDVAAVLDAAGSTRAALYASLDAGPIGMLLAATQPDRVHALVLSNTSARFAVDDDYPIGASREALDATVELVRRGWGTPAFAAGMTPGLSADDHALFAKRLRASATPMAAAAQWRYIVQSLDVRAALPLIRVPTLVLASAQNPLLPSAHGRYLAAHIPDARFVEVPGQSIDWDVDNWPRVITEISQFLLGKRVDVEVDRVLTTVLFTDIVASTERVAALGDRRWHAVLDSHDRRVREELRRFRGREIKSTGDGFHAAFDGPARAIRCARAITDAVRPLGVEVRAGLHTGECDVRGNDLAGLAVHIAARVGSIAGPSEVLVSSTVKDLVVGSGIAFSDNGEHELRGVPGTWRLFAVQG